MGKKSIHSLFAAEGELCTEEAKCGIRFASRWAKRLAESEFYRRQHGRTHYSDTKP
jgi:hypothetical protein